MSPQERRAIELVAGARYGRLALSRHAMPYIAVTRHVVVDEHVLIRAHRGSGVHSACDGSVVGYQADNLDTATDFVWSVHLTGTARVVPAPRNPGRMFEPLPSFVDDPAFEPVHLRIDPEFVDIQFARDVAQWPGPHAA
ncbi:pyridoxamine 5'-phosphate oxidase family protein [Streptomyces sp. H39-S7]|uniref:pyridoxamine 5'-phosphate oxidase family protein n=1 Tax=Streptomyces sp. H39-S7 TaxID=3004357 RepID=UPI0022AF045C|nr:pyridoxamine 5'-phosphate oxidase family protein [Streptomyces sp. H39-S7]MCZ4118017.1 pyridoxamine 5'-phosphate oxidase family protein [Streptomyces sp. H39-S7]